MSAPEHSPIPWHTESDGHVYAADDFSVTHPRIADANARFIITAVNSHAALLAAAKWADGVIDAIGDQTGVPPNVYLSKALKAVIAKVEAIP